MNLKLVYVNKVGYNFKGSVTYEFIFTDADRYERLDVFGEGWDEEYASGYASPPDEAYIFALGTVVVNNYELSCAGDNEYYSVMDARDGVIALAYELIDDTFSTYPRLCFHYWEDLESVTKKLQYRKIEMNIVTNDDDDDYEEEEEYE